VLCLGRLRELRQPREVNAKLNRLVADLSFVRNMLQEIGRNKILRPVEPLCAGTLGENDRPSERIAGAAVTSADMSWSPHWCALGIDDPWSYCDDMASL
jgi:hypothetical protein